MEAPRCLTGAGRESDEPVEIFARSEAGDDGRLQSRRPGAGLVEKAGLSTLGDRSMGHTIE